MFFKIFSKSKTKKLLKPNYFFCVSFFYLFVGLFIHPSSVRVYSRNAGCELEIHPGWDTSLPLGYTLGLMSVINLSTGTFL